MPDVYPRTTGAGYQHGERGGCLPGTRETVLEVIESWAKDSNQPPIFWLNGLTGTGKSAIAQTVVERCDAHGQLVSSFFCSRDVNNHGNPCPIFPTLAIRLGQKDPKFQSVLVSLLRTDPDVVYGSPSDQMEELIVGPVKSMDVPIIIVIDGLDEWMDGASQSAILSTVGYWVKEIPKVKFLVTSRPNPHIQESFHFPFLSDLTTAFSLHNTAPDLTSDDIRSFFRHELSELAFRNGLYPWPTAAQLDLLCDRAAGLFVYAVAAVRFLDRAYAPPSEQYAFIAHSPDDTIHEGTVEGVHRGLSLDSMCISILRASFRDNDDEDDTVVRLVLGAVALVAHPLPPSAIAALICFDVGEVMTILGSIQSLLRLDGDPDRPVLPFHKLLPDLLTSPTRCVDERFYISPEKLHFEIALGCLKLINRTLEGNFSLQNHAVNSEVDYPPGEVALRYACISWHIHLTETRGDFTALIPALLRFLEEGFTTWLEVLSAPGAVGDPVVILNETITWLREVGLGLL